MIGMLLKELYVMKSIGRTYFLMIAIFAIMTVAGLYNFSVFCGMCVMMLTIMPITGFAYDEQAGWDKYAVSTPAGRRGVVQGKYLFGLLMLPLALAMMLILYAITSLLPSRVSMSMGEGAALGAALAGFGLVLLDILLPILFKFGAQKSRLMIMVVTGGTAVAAVGGGLALAGSVDNFEALLPLLTALLFVVALGGFAISYFTSLAIYQKKEL